MRKLAVAVLVAALGGCLAVGGGAGISRPDPEPVVLQETSKLVIEVGQTVRLSELITLKDGRSADTGWTWESENPRIVEVHVTRGEARALAVGETRVVAWPSESPRTRVTFNVSVKT